MILNSRVDDDKVWMNWSWQHMQTISFIRSNQKANTEHVWFIFYVDFIWRPHSIPNYCSEAMNSWILNFLQISEFFLSFIPWRYTYNFLMYQIPIQEEENVDFIFPLNIFKPILFTSTYYWSNNHQKNSNYHAIEFVHKNSYVSQG